MLKRYLIIIIISLGHYNLDVLGADVVVAETMTKDYPFMNEVADLIKNTNNMTKAGETMLSNRECFYEIKVSSLVNNDFRRALSYNSLPFYPNGSYMLEIVYTDFSTFICGEYLFMVKDIRFISSENLFPYFTSCKKDRISFNWSLSFIDRPYLLWHVYVKNGKIEDAFYIYIEYDELGYNTVYNLITGETMSDLEYEKRFGNIAKY